MKWFRGAAGLVVCEPVGAILTASRLPVLSFGFVSRPVTEFLAEPVHFAPAQFLGRDPRGFISERFVRLTVDGSDHSLALSGPPLTPLLLAGVNRVKTMV